MKKSRHQKIIELVSHKKIETQEELADLLNQEGFRVTQATVSRDIKELKLSKVTDGEGRQYYQVMTRNESTHTDKYIRVLREGLLSRKISEETVNDLMCGNALRFFEQPILKG